MMFKSCVYGIPCLIRVLGYEPYVPGRFSGAPEDCYPDEGGYGEWEVCNLKGEPDDDLSNKLSADDIYRIDREMFDFMERKEEIEIG